MEFGRGGIVFAKTKTHQASPTSPFPFPPYLITGPLPSRFHLTRVLTHSTASLTPSPLNALTGSTLESLTPPPFSPSNTRRTSPSFMRTVSTQSSRSCLLARIRMGMPDVAEEARTDSRTRRASWRRVGGLTG